MAVTVELEKIVEDFATALKTVDATAPVGGSGRFKPGVGPLTESEVVAFCLGHLRTVEPLTYDHAAPAKYVGSRATCDLVIPGLWAIEFKLARPFGDNGKPAERWSENLLYPYAGNTSSIGDSLKLLESSITERKAVMVIGYEHTPPKISLEPAIHSFELIANRVVGLQLGTRCERKVSGLIHPYHQQATIYGWEVLGPSRPSA